MRDILNHISGWTEPFALATVVETWSSSPRQPGAAMAVNSAGEVVGSVSGGCVEADLYARCEAVLATGEPDLTRYGVSDGDAFAVGMTCGGTLDVFIQRVDPKDDRLARLADRVQAHLPAAVATVIEGPGVGAQILVLGDQPHGTTGDHRLDDAIAAQVVGLLEHGANRTIRLGAHGEARLEDVAVFVESFAPPARMLIFGAIDFSAALARTGKFLGYHVTVCDARAVFATRARFPEVDEVVVAWPHDYLASVAVDERTAICVLTHDPKFDVPLIQEALRSRAGYIGVMGSRRTHADRMTKLRELGIADAELARLSSPIGLDLGARTPEETAVSITAEIIAQRWGGTGRRLVALETPIHHDSPGLSGMGLDGDHDAQRQDSGSRGGDTDARRSPRRDIRATDTTFDNNRALFARVYVNSGRSA